MKYQFTYSNGTNRVVECGDATYHDIWEYARFPEQIKRFGTAIAIEYAERQITAEVKVEQVLDIFTNKFTGLPTVQRIDIFDHRTGEVLWHCNRDKLEETDFPEECEPCELNILKMEVMNTKFDRYGLTIEV